MPGLINTHVHLEFSANKTTLKYGNFMDWLYSVMNSREELVEKSNQTLIEKELKKILKTGTTTIGAISSYGFDLQPCIKSALNVVYFNEVIGSKPEMIDTLFSDFKARLNSTLQYTSKRFIPAIAIHSPYSVHPFLVREVLKIAKEKELCVTAHFLESSEEKEWLKNNSGGFLDFFMKLLGQKQSVTSPLEFLSHFKGIHPLSFTHCVEANEEELEKIGTLQAVINHCPTSNRILNNTKLNLDVLHSIPFSLGTDGLSSNNSLSMFDEMRNALMIHTHKNINVLAKKLLKAATRNGANALGLNKGSLEENKESDMIALTLPDTLQNIEDLATHIILHTKYVNRTIIGGKDV
jgi:cytosine/adenosine deaminase-related metal-dependent hydrolase